MKKRIILPSTIALALVAAMTLSSASVADDSVPAASNDGDLAAIVAYKTQIRDELKSRIAQIDSEMSRCKKAKTNWTVATVVGGVGTVATGVGAIVQNNTIQNKKHELNTKNSELSDKQDQLNQMNRQ